MNFVLFLTPSFIAGDFKVMPTWLSYLVDGLLSLFTDEPNADLILSGALNLAMWLIPFLVCLAGLHVILFKPMMAYLGERDQQTDGARDEAKELNALVDDRIETLNQRLQDARNQAGQLRSAARATAAAKGQEIIDAARTEAEANVADAVKRIQTERDTAAQALKQSATALSADIAGQVLGRTLQA